jgi:hypothetical protein
VQVADKRIVDFIDNTNLSLYRPPVDGKPFELPEEDPNPPVGGSAAAAAIANPPPPSAPAAPALPLLLNDKSVTLDTCSVVARIVGDPISQPVSVLEVKNTNCGSTEVDVLCSAIAQNPFSAIRTLNLSDTALVDTARKPVDLNGVRGLGLVLSAFGNRVEELILNNCRLGTDLDPSLPIPSL